MSKTCPLCGEDTDYMPRHLPKCDQADEYFTDTDKKYAN